MLDLMFRKPVIPQTFSETKKSSKSTSKRKNKLDSVVLNKENARPDVLTVPGPTNPDQPQLRYYIQKLLNLRQEDIRNLSVSSCTTPERPMKSKTKERTPSLSTLSLSSTSCSLKKS